MKLIHLVPFSLLFMATSGNEAFTPSFAGGPIGVAHSEHSRHDERQLRIIPTLLGKFMDIRSRFDFFGEIFSNFLFGLAPSEAPSMTPSDTPTTAPSDAPVVAPSKTPSAAPFIWKDVLGEKSHGFEVCSYDPKPIDFSKSTEITVMYSYQMELKPSAQVVKVIEKVEELLQEKLNEQVCVTSTDTLGLASDPADRPGGICRPMGHGTCYVIAGRLTLLIGVPALSDVSAVYCEFLEAIREYLSGGEVTKRVSEIATMNSTILERLVPTFCTIRVGNEGVVDLVGEGTTTESSNDSASKTTLIPIVLSLVVCAVALAAMYVYIRHRRAIHDTPFVPSTCSGSDLNFENSDESESRPQSLLEDRNSAMANSQTNSLPQRSAVAASNTRELPPEVLFSPANFQPPQGIFSPTHTEHEIIFSPSSTVASSVLFRSP
jgi:hypothetical protein